MSRSTRDRLSAVTLFAALLAGGATRRLVASAAPASDAVLLVTNDTSVASGQLAAYYASRRSIGPDHIVHLKTADTDSISRALYDQQIEGPIGAWISSHALQDRILYLVLTKGIPLRIEGSGGPEGTVASVDSELTLLYLRLEGQHTPIVGHVPNPYFLGTAPISTARPFNRSTAEIYLVTRLDGFTVNDVTKLIDRAQTPSQNGSIVLRQRSTVIDRGGDQWLLEASTRLATVFGPGRVRLAAGPDATSQAGPVLGYYSWGSNDATIRSRQTGLTFSNGAIGATFVSTDGRTFNEPPAGWLFSDPNGRGPQFAGSFQSLAGDLIREGITGVAANVAEPYLDASPRPQILFPAYLAGFNLAEAFYLSIPYLSWEEIVIGDPLCAPFANPAAAPEPDRGLDPDTDLPALFSARRLAVLSAGGLSPHGLKLLLKAEAHVSDGRQSDVDSLLAQAVAAEPRLTAARLRLASRAEAAGEVGKAAEEYRQILAYEPNNIVALNNLAFDLADKQHSAREALPLAERAYQLAPSPEIADTLAWVNHLLGDDQAALRLLEEATRPGATAEMLVHAAFVCESLHDTVRAKANLDRALSLDGQLRSRSDVSALIERLKGGLT